MDMFLSSLIQLIWPLLAVFGLIVSSIARRKHPGDGTTMMVIGSALSLLVSLTNTSVSLGVQNDLLDYSNISTIYVVTGILGLIGQVLFWAGLLTFVNGLRSSEERPLGQ